MAFVDSEFSGWRLFWCCDGVEPVRTFTQQNRTRSVLNCRIWPRSLSNCDSSALFFCNIAWARTFAYLFKKIILWISSTFFLILLLLLVFLRCFKIEMFSLWPTMLNRSDFFWICSWFKLKCFEISVYKCEQSIKMNFLYLYNSIYIKN